MLKSPRSLDVRRRRRSFSPPRPSSRCEQHRSNRRQPLLLFPAFWDAVISGFPGPFQQLARRHSRRRHMTMPTSSRRTKKRPSASSLPAEARDWATLPQDALLEVFHRVGAHDILWSAEFVCKPWRRVAVEEPTLWRRVDMTAAPMEHFDTAVRDIVDRSKGLLEAFSGPWDDISLLFIGARFTPLPYFDFDEAILMELVDGDIYRTPMMCQLQSIEVFNYVFSNEQLAAILDNCPLLVSLHITGHHVDGVMDEQLRAKCARVKNLNIPFKFDQSEGDSGQSDFSEDDEPFIL
ncbi:hypothetical protein PR202_gb28566 [Eleusine coracana subsp. coracana]|uniref:F-box domain-containing protein n=1 Tax=Eleusine coracana subsp. coracana TaxID=191504 RepID=A0AAV5FY75_ELECO|nr:hypothetical protein PR202_gb28566 [Eleusine coracana subsp. coracana]